MRKLSIRQVREVLGRLDHLLDKVGEVQITRHGKTIARVLPARDKRTMPSHAELRAAMQPLSNSSADLIRTDRDSR